MASKFLYVDPIGNYTETELNYSNIQPLQKKKQTINARENSSNKKKNSNNLQLILWSLVVAVLILFLLMIFRNLNE
jgi:hypothetical protein